MQVLAILFPAATDLELERAVRGAAGAARALYFEPSTLWRLDLPVGVISALRVVPVAAAAVRLLKQIVIIVYRVTLRS